MGYLGGVNCNILVAFICQLYPKACPYALLQGFFRQYMKWDWQRTPIQLNNIQKLNIDKFDEQVWTAEKSYDLMPLITPAYPAMNSSYNVNSNTLHVMKEEFTRGYDVILSLLKERKWQDPQSWGKLFEPSDFFLKYSHYLACHIVGDGDSSRSRSWIGFVESRLRRLTVSPFLERLPLRTPIHLYPVSHADSEHSVCYFIGFHIDYAQLEESGTKELFIDHVIAQFM
jgi:poly(A) polymerase